MIVRRTLNWLHFYSAMSFQSWEVTGSMRQNASRTCEFDESTDIYGIVRTSFLGEGCVITKPNVGHCNENKMRIFFRWEERAIGSIDMRRKEHRKNYLKSLQNAN